MDKHVWIKRALYLPMIGSIQFVILTLIAMINYTGGTRINPDNIGYSFFHNFFSDLGRTISYSGDSNLTSVILFVCAISFSGFSFLVFFLSIPIYFKNTNIDTRAVKVSSIIGITSSIMFIGIGFAPDNLFSEIHDFFVVSAFFLAFLSSILLIFLTYSNKRFSILFPLGYFVLACLIFLYGIIGLLFFNNYSETGLFIRVASQKIVVYSMMISFFLESYGNLKVYNSISKEIFIRD